MNDISIVSVIYTKDSYKKFEVNYNLTNKVSKTKNWVWHVGLNNSRKLKNLKMLKNNNIIYHEGFELDNSIPISIKGSYNHAECLNKIVRTISTKYLIVIDYDFYIILPNWTEIIINHIKKNDLEFFGAPWHPKWTSKYRNFPAVHFMVINLLKINKTTLDFSPQYNFKNIYQKNKIKGLLPNYFLTKIKNNYIRKLLLVCSSRDTGYKIYQRYKNYKYELLIPVYDTIKKEYNLFILFIENLLPYSFKLLPRYDYYCDTPFLELGEKGWEQFLWNDKPFGFHIRGEMNKNNNDYKAIINCLKHSMDFHN